MKNEEFAAAGCPISLISLIGLIGPISLMADRRQQILHSSFIILHLKPLSLHK